MAAHPCTARGEGVFQHPPPAYAAWGVACVASLRRRLQVILTFQRALPTARPTAKPP
jgi:hypothetical protein